MSDLKDALAVLELPPKTTRSEVKKSYRTLLKVWHPDRFTGDPEMQATAEERTKRITVAYGTVMDYLQTQQDAAQTGPSAEEIRRREAAEARRRAAEQARQRQWASEPSAGADAEPSVPSADTQSVLPIAETRRRVMPLVLSIVALVCLGVWLAASPYITLWRLNTALTNSDVETLNALVDWESVRAEVKSELATVIGVATQSSDVSTSSSFVGLAATFLSNAAVGMAVDTFVTAENMVQLSAGQLPVPDLSGLGVLGDALATGIQGATAEQFDELKTELTSRVDYSTGYTSPMAFEILIFVNKTAAGGDFDNPEDNTLLPVARILMRRSGLGWTVQGVQFAAEVQNLIKRIA